MYLYRTFAIFIPEVTCQILVFHFLNSVIAADYLLFFFFLAIFVLPMLSHAVIQCDK